ncbi:mediator of RNA polymerase II transcription subunit 7 [Diutina catenulata]
MSDELISSLYPPPPPFVKFFTDENLEKLAALPQSDDVPPGELRFLVPPKQPEGEVYRGYGNIWSFKDKLPSLKDTEWDQLYPANDEHLTSETKIAELHKLVDSLLLNFLELIGIVSIDPAKFEPKIKDISLILININHLLNTYRPHQSRESLIMFLRKQIEQKRKEMDEIDKVSADVRQKIAGLTKDDLDEYEDPAVEDADVDTETPADAGQRTRLIEQLLSQI